MEKEVDFSERCEFGRRINDPKHNNWEEIDVRDFKITRPIVIVLGGLGTYDGKKANGYCKVVESMLGVFADHADILGAVYGDKISSARVLQGLVNAVENLFVPLISKNDKRLSLTEACRNMRMVTLVAHCYGANVAKDIGKILAEKMAELGYTETEQDKILEQIFLVSYASYVNNNALKFKFLYITSSEDDMLFVNGYWIWNNLLKNTSEIDFSEEDLEKIKALEPDEYGDIDILPLYKGKERCFVCKKEKGIYLAPTHLHKNNLNDHTFVEMARGKNWEHHTNVSRAGDFVSRCLSCALCHSVSTSMLNQETKELVSIDMNNLKAELENVVRPLNKEGNDFSDVITKH